MDWASGMVDGENKLIGGADDDGRKRRVRQKLESRHGNDVVTAETVKFKSSSDAVRTIGIVSAEIKTEGLTVDRTG